MSLSRSKLGGGSRGFSRYDSPSIDNAVRRFGQPPMCLGGLDARKEYPLPMQGSAADGTQVLETASAIEAAYGAMEAAGDRDGVLRALVLGAASQLRAVQLFIVRGKAIRIHLRGGDTGAEKASGGEFALAAGSVAHRAVVHGLMYLGPVPAAEASEGLYEGAAASEGLVISPITLGKRTVCLLVGHPRGAISRGLRDEMAQLSYQASVALARLLGKTPDAPPPSSAEPDSTTAGGPPPEEISHAEAPEAKGEAARDGRVAKEEARPKSKGRRGKHKRRAGGAKPTPPAVADFGATGQTAPASAAPAEDDGATMLGLGPLTATPFAPAEAPEPAAPTPAMASPAGAASARSPSTALASGARSKTDGWKPWAALGVSQVEQSVVVEDEAAAEPVATVAAEQKDSQLSADERAVAVPLVARQPEEPVVEDAVVPLTRVKAKRGKRRKSTAAPAGAQTVQPEAGGEVAASPPLADEPEHREFDRLPVVVEVHHESDHNFFTGFMEDISEGGLFVATHAVPRIGTKIEISFTLPGLQGTCVARCRVRWLRDYNPNAPDGIPGMGLAFCDLAGPAREAVERFIKQRQPIFFED